MTAREYLEQARSLDKRIDAKLAYKYKLETLSLKLTASYGGVQVRGSEVNRQPERIALLAEDIDADVDAMVDLKREIGAAISKVDNDMYRALLEYRYLSCMTWEQIAEVMELSDRYVRGKLHANALSCFVVPCSSGC